MPFRIAIVLFALALATNTNAQVVSPFAGSEAAGEYQSDFVRYSYLVENGDEIESTESEGRLRSRIYKQPENKSNYEIFRSFENALRDSGFEIITRLDDKQRVELLLRDINGKKKNALGQRNYRHEGKATPVLIKALVETQAQEYIAAHKRIDDSDLLVFISTSRDGLYVIDELESAAMEEGTVVLTLDTLRKGMKDEGRVAIYGIYFDTGSATIKAESEEALATIEAYLRENPEQSFYVVGHTDDEGRLSGNMTLSSARAEAVTRAITERLPNAEQRLTPHGVGPLSPVATNGNDSGRSLNRRVELVSRLPE